MDVTFLCELPCFPTDPSTAITRHCEVGTLVGTHVPGVSSALARGTSL